jgi:hypothetical protein
MPVEKAKVTFDAVSEAYCLLSSYLREDGKVKGRYNEERLQSFVVFLAELMKHDEVDLSKVEFDKQTPEHDGTGLA